MIDKERVIDPTRICEYLKRHGWTAETPIDPEVTVFVYDELSDDGNEMTVYVPASKDVLAYPLRVHDVVVTVAGLEERPMEAVLADMMATNPTPATPAVPLLNGHPAVSAESVPGLPTK